VEASARWFCDDIIDPWLEVAADDRDAHGAGLGLRIDRGKLARYKVQERNVRHVTWASALGLLRSEPPPHQNT
jgi:hypothetical protein